MPKRVTIILDDENLKRLRLKQAAMIKKSAENVSLSRVINDVVRESKIL